MSGFIYCMSGQSDPTLIQLGQSRNDPRVELSVTDGQNGSRKINWMVRVDDPAAAFSKITNALSEFSEGTWQSQFRCNPARARGVAIRFAQAENRMRNIAAVARPALPAIVLALGLAVQFLGFTNGHTGPSAALIAAALFWVVYTLPIGTGGRAETE